DISEVHAWKRRLDSPDIWFDVAHQLLDAESALAGTAVGSAECHGLIECHIIDLPANTADPIDGLVNDVGRGKTRNAVAAAHGRHHDLGFQRQRDMATAQV